MPKYLIFNNFDLEFISILFYMRFLINLILNIFSGFISYQYKNEVLNFILFLFFLIKCFYKFRFVHVATFSSYFEIFKLNSSFGKRTIFLTVNKYSSDCFPQQFLQNCEVFETSTFPNFLEIRFYNTETMNEF